MKILLGGVPFGFDNIGDEAILASVVGILRRDFPEAELAVCTNDRIATAQKLSLQTYPPYGFLPKYPVEKFGEILDGIDVYIWAGATGLSDYPEPACALMLQAQRHGLRTIVWNVGMNSDFNPAFYRPHGKTEALCRLVKKIAFLDPADWIAAVKSVRPARAIAHALAGCSLVVVRDPASLANLRRCAPFPHAVSGADSAILQRGIDPEKLPWNPGGAERFRSFGKRIGLCISAQSAVRNMDVLRKWADGLTADPACGIVMIPMNPKTDFELMSAFRDSLARPESALLTRFREPEEVQALAGACSLIVSSRLHLLILGLNRLVPGIGIARGSKISSFLDAFGLPTAGTTDSVDGTILMRETKRLLEQKDFSVNAGCVRDSLIRQLHRAESLLISTLQADD